jgi:hypothetical protein
MTCTADFDRVKGQTPPAVREGAPRWQNRKLSDSNKNLVLGPRWGLTPRLTGRLTFGCNVTVTLASRVNHG